MAEKSGGLGQVLNKKANFTGRIATRLPQNPLHRLHYRELGGIHRHHRQSVTSQIFLKLPGRLGFSLRCLVDESVLHEGVVFLGFSKNGQFVLSYTLNVEADEHTAYPIYVYRLQWWRFIPYKRLKKIAEVRLFGEEEIQQELFVSVCEWPTDDSRVVIHGYCAPRDNEEKHQCYITITAVPPIGPCEDCSQLAILQVQNGYYGGSSELLVRCLQHALTVHTRYELAPPYPLFAPRVFLRLDGAVVVNTGDSLIALSVSVEDDHSSAFGCSDGGGDGGGGELYSPQRAESIASSDSHPLDELLENIAGQSPCTRPAGGRTPRHGKENILRQLGSPARPVDVYAFEAGTPSKDDEFEPSPAEASGYSSGSGGLRATLSMQPGARMQNTLAEEISLTTTTHHDSRDGDVFDKPTPPLRAGKPPFPTLAVIANNNNNGGGGGGNSDGFTAGFGKALCISPGYGKLADAGGGSSTCSSCVSSPIILQSDSQCFTYSVRRYMESYGPVRPDSPIDIEDDLNLAYHSVLPLEVHGANYCNMRLLTKVFPTPHTPCIVVKQLTLDIEHYLGETVRTSAEWGNRYLAFTDYDIQILEVCADTSEVIALVFVLIRARPPKEGKHARGMRSMPKLYESSFKLVWNLKTGSYKTLDIESLIEVNQAEMLRKRWQPGQRICDALQRRYAVPQVYSRSVHVLTNEPVFKGRSLKMLLDRHHYVAILL